MTDNPNQEKPLEDYRGDETEEPRDRNDEPADVERPADSGERRIAEDVTEAPRQ